MKQTKDPKVTNLMDTLSSNATAPAQANTGQSTAVAHIDASLMLAAMCEKEGVPLPENFQGTSKPVAEKIKIIANGAYFEMPDEEKRDYICGSIVGYMTTRAYWETEESKIPECSSKWGDIPDMSITEPKSKNCPTCEFARWKSGKNGAQACTASVRLFFLIDGDDEKIPYIVSLPPTSIKAWDLYLTKLQKSKKKYYEVMTTITLRKEKGSGFTYSIAILEAEKIENHYNNDLSKIQPRLQEIVRLLGEVKKMADVEITRDETPDEASNETTGEVIEETQGEA